jgi:four helix bundle protein
MPNSSGGGGSEARPGSYKDLIVWQKAMDLAVEVYRIAAKFPGREVYGLGAQTTRAAASVPANIAEGRGRATRKGFAHFLSVAKGSLMETETFVSLAIRLGYTQPTDAERILNLVTEVSKMLTKLRIRLLEAKDSSSS